MLSGPSALPPPVRAVGSTSDGQALVVLSGEVDITSRPALSEVGAWLREGGLAVVVDASEVTFLDCSGWSAVCSLAPPGSEPVLRAPSPAARRLLDLLGRTEHAPAGVALTPLLQVPSLGTEQP